MREEGTQREESDVKGLEVWLHDFGYSSAVCHLTMGTGRKEFDISKTKMPSFWPHHETNGRWPGGHQLNPPQTKRYIRHSEIPS